MREEQTAKVVDISMFEGGNAHFLATRIPESLNDMLERVAKEQGVAVPDLVRTALSTYLAPIWLDDVMEKHGSNLSKLSQLDAENFEKIEKFYESYLDGIIKTCETAVQLRKLATGMQEYWKEAKKELSGKLTRKAKSFAKEVERLHT